jgi:hypothetical protein
LIFAQSTTDILRTYRYYKTLGERRWPRSRTRICIRRSIPSQTASRSSLSTWRAPRSRWRDFLTTDGEKPDRKRDGEFEMPPGTSRETVAVAWDAGFGRLETALAQVTPADLLREVAIRAERQTAVQALNRALAHLGYHVGQVVFLAKHFAGRTGRRLRSRKAGRPGRGGDPEEDLRI